MEYNYDYFVSYAHADNDNGFVAKFVDELRNNEAFRQLFNASPRVFFDQTQLHGMDDWNARISQGIAHARFFIAMISPNYFKSDFCRYEFDWWLSREGSDVSSAKASRRCRSS